MAAGPDWTILSLLAFRSGAVVHRQYPLPAAPRAPLVLEIAYRRLLGDASAMCFCTAALPDRRKRESFVRAALREPRASHAAYAAVAAFVDPTAGEPVEPEELISGVDRTALDDAAPGPLLAVVDTRSASVRWAIVGPGDRAADGVRLALDALFRRYLALSAPGDRVSRAI